MSFKVLGNHTFLHCLDKTVKFDLMISSLSIETGEKLEKKTSKLPLYFNYLNPLGKTQTINLLNHL